MGVFMPMPALILESELIPIIPDPMPPPILIPIPVGGAGCETLVDATGPNKLARSSIAAAPVPDPDAPLTADGAESSRSMSERSFCRPPSSGGMGFEADA